MHLKQWLAPVAALGVLAAVGVLPALYASADTAPRTLPSEVAAAESVTRTPVTVPAMLAVSAPRPDVPDPTEAQGTESAGLVAAEDGRLRTALRASLRLTEPTIVSTPGSLPTLVLPATQSVWSLSTLESVGAARQLGASSVLLTENVFVAPHARLTIDGIDRLLLASSPSGFASLVNWQGHLALSSASSTSMLAVSSWDQSFSRPDTDTADGRAYVRDVGGEMTLDRVDASDLGFWSGRTGGVAWTGRSATPGTGGATASQFHDSFYGVFTTHTEKLMFRSDAFFGNQRDGLRLHRGTADTVVSDSSSYSNDGTGIAIARGNDSNLIESTVVQDNGGDGIDVDSRPLSQAAGPSGDAPGASAGTQVLDSTLTGNTGIGVLLEGGSGIILRGDSVCSTTSAIEVRDGAYGIVVDDNQLPCHGRDAIVLGPGTSQSAVTGNDLAGERIGVLAESVSNVSVQDNRIAGVSVYGISFRGAAGTDLVSKNTISGAGYRAVDTASASSSPKVTANSIMSFTARRKTGVVAYLRFHPLLYVWVAAVGVILAMSVLRYGRRHGTGQDSPYPTSSSTAETPPVAPVPAVAAPATAARAHPTPTGRSRSHAGSGATASHASTASRSTAVIDLRDDQRRETAEPGDDRLSALATSRSRRAVRADRR